MEEARMIDWSTRRTHVLLNPRLPLNDQEKLERRGRAARLPGHVIIATSGSSGTLKLVALSKEAVLASAAAVNERLEATAADAWCCVLPTFHVGGLGIHARAHLAGSRIITMSWVPQAFASTEATLASLVPAQVHDLVSAGLKPPSRLRAILVGGGALNSDLNEAARALGWPVLPSYGMSECSSTVAVRDVLLSHLEARHDESGRLAFRGPSLFTGYITEAGLTDPKIDGWFVTDDVGEVDGRTLRVHGRRGDFIKIGGESVDLARLDQILESVRGTVDAAIVAVGDDRLGNVIHLAATSDAQEVIERFNALVAPFERIRATHPVSSIPRSSLGKLLRGELARRLTPKRGDDRDAVQQPERNRQ
jgi:O-succinylbenzoic acid--CoA ligase